MLIWASGSFRPSYRGVSPSVLPVWWCRYTSGTPRVYHLLCPHPHSPVNKTSWWCSYTVLPVHHVFTMVQIYFRSTTCLPWCSYTSGPPRAYHGAALLPVHHVFTKVQLYFRSTTCLPRCSYTSGPPRAYHLLCAHPHSPVNKTSLLYSECTVCPNP
jgi:hypothetical protein